MNFYLSYFYQGESLPLSSLYQDITPPSFNFQAFPHFQPMCTCECSCVGRKCFKSTDSSQNRNIPLSFSCCCHHNLQSRHISLSHIFSHSGHTLQPTYIHSQTHSSLVLNYSKIFFHFLSSCLSLHAPPPTHTHIPSSVQI